MGAFLEKSVILAEKRSQIFWRRFVGFDQPRKRRLFSFPDVKKGVSAQSIKGSVLYRQENVDSVRTQDALQSVIDTAKMTSEYMAILENAPRLKASGLHGDYRVLADFGSAVLAGHPTERGVQFVTWEWDFDREGIHHGHYFQQDYDAAKRDFTVRSNLVPKDTLFEPEQLAEIYCALAFVREQDETLSCGRDQELAELMDQVGGLLPPNTAST